MKPLHHTPSRLAQVRALGVRVTHDAQIVEGLLELRAAGLLLVLRNQCLGSHPTAHRLNNSMFDLIYKINQT